MSHRTRVAAYVVAIVIGGFIGWLSRDYERNPSPATPFPSVSWPPLDTGPPEIPSA